MNPTASPISAGDTAWVLVASALVMLMLPGLALFYGGLVRGKNSLNTLMMSVVQRSPNARYAGKRSRSTTAPEMRAKVIAANIAWKMAKARCGMVPAYVALGAPPTPANPHHWSPPITVPPGAKARE